MSKTVLVRRSMRIGGLRTTLALERCFWGRLEALAANRGVSVPQLLGLIDEERKRLAPSASLASRARVFALMH